MPTRITSPESRNTGLRIQHQYGSYVEASREGVKLDGVTYVGDLRKLERKLGLAPGTLEGGEVLLRRGDGTVRIASKPESMSKRGRMKRGTVISATHGKKKFRTRPTPA